MMKPRQRPPSITPNLRPYTGTYTELLPQSAYGFLHVGWIIEKKIALPIAKLLLHCHGKFTVQTRSQSGSLAFLQGPTYPSIGAVEWSSLTCVLTK